MNPQADKSLLRFLTSSTLIRIEIVIKIRRFTLNDKTSCLTENILFMAYCLTSISSLLVLSGISLSITVHLVWLGRTFWPSGSTWTFWDSENENSLKFRQKKAQDLPIRLHAYQLQCCRQIDQKVYFEM